MKYQVLKTERYFNIYRNSDEDKEREILLNIPFETLLAIVSPKDDDPLLYEGYLLNEEQVAKMKSLMDESFLIDFEKYFYVLECVGIYDFNANV